jgi:multiple antibiotic resistance protein
MQSQYLLGASEVFTLFFIMLGPLKLLGPFSKATHHVPESTIHSLAWKSTLILTPLLVIFGYVGLMLTRNWHIPLTILELTSGLIFAYVAFMLILKPKKDEPPETAPEINPLSVALGMILTPYGVATLILLLASSQDEQRTLLIFALLGLNMFLNFLAMFFIRPLMGKAGSIFMMMLGSVLGVLQAALALFIIHASLISLHAQMISTQASQ